MHGYNYFLKQENYFWVNPKIITIIIISYFKSYNSS